MSIGYIMSKINIKGIQWQQTNTKGLQRRKSFSWYLNEVPFESDDSVPEIH